MEHTEYHQLSLWDEDDRILMEDFNSDNAKTEAGLLEKIGRMEFIQNVSTTPASSSFSTLPLPDMDWDAWETVLLISTMTYAEDQSYNFWVNNGSTRAINSHGGTQIAKVGVGPFALIFLPCHDSSRRVQLFYVGRETGMGITETATFDQMTQLEISYHGSGTYYFSSPKTFALYGVR